jgi:aspartate kinase
MKRIVQKYGGTSVGSPERIRNVAARIKRFHDEGVHLAVVVSAMSGETNRLLALAHEITELPAGREVDVLLSTGEQVMTALLSLALHDIGVPAVSLQGHQINIATDAVHGRARIKFIDGSRITAAFAEGKVAVIPGFQGINVDGDITTLGRGGSDTSAVALAAALKADACEIYTDVDGVYTTDPRICPDAIKISRVSHEEMLESASVGAKVLQIRSVECAMRHNVPLHVRSSFNDNEGSWVVPEETSMDEVVVTNIACEKDEAKITLEGVPDTPGLAAQIFGPLAAAGIVVDMIVQNVSRADDAKDRRTDMTFTVSKADRARAVATVEEVCTKIGAKKVVSSDEAAKISVVGLGMRSHAGVAADMFAAFAEADINIEMISTSEIKISVVIATDDADRAVRVLHERFITDAAGRSGTTTGESGGTAGS